MNRFGFVTAAAAFVAFLAVADEPPDDPIGRKLAAAKKGYSGELAKALKTAGEALEKAENAARKKGDRVAAAKLKAERKGLEDDKEFPPSGAANLRKRLITQQAKLETAHEQAIKDYVKAGDDKSAANVAKSLSDLRMKFVGVVQLAPRKIYRIVNRNSGLAMAVKIPEPSKPSQVCQAKIADDPFQLWTVASFPHEGGTVYSFTNVGARLAICISGASRSPGSELITWPENAEMRWHADPKRGGLCLRWILSGLAVGVADSSKEPGHRVIQWSEHTDALEQVWNFIEVDAKGR
jgi:hypothetical protein